MFRSFSENLRELPEISSKNVTQISVFKIATRNRMNTSAIKDLHYEQYFRILSNLPSLRRVRFNKLCILDISRARNFRQRKN